MILYHISDAKGKNPKVNSQIAFCSEESLRLIKFNNSYEVK